MITRKTWFEPFFEKKNQRKCRASKIFVDGSNHFGNNFIKGDCKVQTTTNVITEMWSPRGATMAKKKAAKKATKKAAKKTTKKATKKKKK